MQVQYPILAKFEIFYQGRTVFTKNLVGPIPTNRREHIGAYKRARVQMSDLEKIFPMSLGYLVRQVETNY